MAYEKQTWNPYNDDKTEAENQTAGGVVMADRLNHMEAGISDAEKSAVWGTVSGKPTTFPPTIGTTAATAKAGNYQPAWDDITGKPAVIAAGADAAAARTAIGAGTPYNLPAATTSANGGVKKMAAQADSTATDIEGIVADLNALLAKMRTAGMM